MHFIEDYIITLQDQMLTNSWFLFIWLIDSNENPNVLIWITDYIIKKNMKNNVFYISIDQNATLCLEWKNYSIVYM